MEPARHLINLRCSLRPRHSERAAVFRMKQQRASSGIDSRETYVSEVPRGRLASEWMARDGSA